MSKTWADVEDGVLTHYVASVLGPNRNYTRVRGLLTTAGYVDQKFLRIGLPGLLDDLRTARRIAPGAEVAAELDSLESALIEAAQILQDAPEQLRGQLLARIPRPAAADVERLLDEDAGWHKQTWWRPSGTVQNHGHLVALGPAPGMVDALAFSDDGSILLSGDRDGNLHAWQVLDRAQISSQALGCGINAIAFRPGSFEAFLALADGVVARWSPGERRLRHHEEFAEHEVTSVAVGRDALVCGGGNEVRGGPVAANGTAWRSSAGAELVTAVAITGDGTRCVVGGHDGGVVLRDLADGRELRRYETPVDRVLCLAALPDSGTVVVAGKNARVVAVDVDTGEVRTVGRHRNQVRSAAALDGRRVATGSYDGQVLTWDVGPGTSRRAGAHTGWCLAVAAPRNGGPLATGGTDGRLRLWDPAGEVVAGDARRHIRSVVVDGGIAYGGTDRRVHRADLRTGEQLTPLTGHRGIVDTLVVTAHGVASGSGDNTIRRWDRAGGRPLVLSGHESGVRALAVTPDGAEIISASGDGTWRRWDARTGEAGPVARSAGGHYHAGLALSPDGEFVVAATDQHVIEVWQRESSRHPTVLEGHTSWVESLVVLPGNRLLISGSWDKTLRVWDLAAGTLLWTLQCKNWIVDLAAPTDGKLVAAFCADGTIFVVEPAAQTVLSTLELGGESYGRLALDGDDRTLFVLSSYELQAWDLTSGARLATFDADLPLRRLAVAGDSAVVVGTEVGTLVTMRLERA